MFKRKGGSGLLMEHRYARHVGLLDLWVLPLLAVVLDAMFDCFPIASKTGHQAYSNLLQESTSQVRCRPAIVLSDVTMLQIST